MPQVPSPILLIFWYLSESRSMGELTDRQQIIIIIKVISYRLQIIIISNINNRLTLHNLMIGKLFQARSKLQDLDALKKYLQKSQLTRDDYINLLRHCFEHQRDKFLKVAEILKLYDKNILQAKLKDYPVLLQLCKIGTADEVSGLLKIQPIKFLDKKNQSFEFALQNTQRKGDRIEAHQIIKVLYSAQPNLIHNKSLVSQAIQRQQYQCAQFFIQKGAQVSHPLPDKENLLHLLLRGYNRKYQKQIMKIRSMLIERGVDERQSNINNKKPFQLCPVQIEKRIIQQHKSQAGLKKVKGDQNIRYKGKSQEAPEYSRNKVTQYRQKVEGQPLFRIDSKDQLYKMADNIIDKKNKQKQRQLMEKQRERDMKEKLKEKQRKEKIMKRVFTPDELKHFLNEDINYFMERIEEANNIQKQTLTFLIDKIQSKIMQDFGATVKIFGSFATQLCLQQSDIDMVIIPDDKKEQSSFKLLEDISNLLEAMHDQVETVKFIKTASVPIIKIQCSKKYLSKKIDITYKDENHNGLISVDLIVKYLAIYPHLRPLTFVLKKFIYSTNIYDPYSGGLSSYGLILMIVAYLQNQNRQRKKRGGIDTNKSPTIAQLLIGFLYFYGFKCNYISKQINILDAERAKAEVQATELKYAQQPIYLDTVVDIQLMMYPNDWQPRAKLVIIDPLNPQNNIGRATHKIREIKTAFQMAYVSIHTNKTCRGKKSCESYKRIQSLSLKQTKYQNLQRPCCIITRMLNSTKSFMVV